MKIYLTPLPSKETLTSLYSEYILKICLNFYYSIGSKLITRIYFFFGFRVLNAFKIENLKYFKNTHQVMATYRFLKS